MKSQNYSQGWRSYLTSSFFLVVFGLILFILNAVFSIQKQSEVVRNSLNEKVSTNEAGEIVIKSDHIKTDTLHVYVNKHYKKYVEIDTINLDTTINK